MEEDMKEMNKNIEMNRDYSPEDYIKDVLVVENVDKEAIEKRFSEPQIYRMMHAAFGMSTEANELLDMLKKHIYYGKELDLVNIEEELGDSNWYQSEMIDALRQTGYDTSWEKIWKKNIAKLNKRYKSGTFTAEEALNRNLDAERTILEDND